MSSRTDPVRRARRVRATATLRPVADDGCEFCGHPELEHFVDGSCSHSCPQCEVLDDDQLPEVPE